MRANMSDEKSRDDRWMQKAFSNSHGQFKAKAKNAGMSTLEFANHVLANKDRYSPLTVKQANLAKSGIRMSRKR